MLQYNRAIMDHSQQQQPQDDEETLRSIHAMRRQEETEYFCHDYFDPHHNTTTTTSTTSKKNPSDAQCRQIMFHWMIRVVDFFPAMNRETVAFAMSYLDRFLQSQAGTEARRNRSVFQLAAISCLYTSVKIHEHAAVSPKFLEQLSRDEYSVKDVESMELRILGALKWRLATPTACAFLRLFLEILPSTPELEDRREEIYDLAKFQTEMALGDYKYVTVNKSSIAYCALLNALETVPAIDTRHWALVLSKAAHIDREYALPIQHSLALDHADHASLKGSPVSAVYEPTLIQSIRSQSSGYHSPRTVCK